MTINTVKAWLESLPEDHKIPIVLDPVMVATSGAKLLNDDAIQGVKEVMKFCDVVTPNLKEAEVLVGRELKTTEDVEKGEKNDNTNPICHLNR